MYESLYQIYYCTYFLLIGYLHYDIKILDFVIISWFYIILKLQNKNFSALLKAYIDYLRKESKNSMYYNYKVKAR